MEYYNPILPGYHPDPSVCRVGEDFYLVNSTFEFFPGVPVYHSRNLVNWELKGYCLSKKDQLMLEKCNSSAGIYAPTLRYHDGTFFMTTTNVSHKGNFIVHSKDPDRGWSKPNWVNQGGIDPSLLFDEDGKVYFTSTGEEEGRSGIFLCEINPFTGEKLTNSVCISYGCGGKFPEGPHLYKKDGYYYLMLAEGGTEYGHMETIQRAKSPYGPYERCPHNPILTNRDDASCDICCTGHADLTEDQYGNWWVVCLGIRTCSTRERRVLLHNLGRETFLAPLEWIDGWPVVQNKGVIQYKMEGPLPAAAEESCYDFYDDFTNKPLSLQYNWLRNPVEDSYQLDHTAGKCLLKGTRETLNDLGSPTWMGIRQQCFFTVTTASMEFIAGSGHGRAGITSYYNDSCHYEIYVFQNQENYYIGFSKHLYDMEVRMTPVCVGTLSSLFLRIETDKMHYVFSYSPDGLSFSEVGRGLTVGLCTESTQTMTFTGTYLAMFAEDADAIFTSFSVKQHPKKERPDSLIL